MSKGVGARGGITKYPLDILYVTKKKPHNLKTFLSVKRYVKGSREAQGTHEGRQGHSADHDSVIENIGDPLPLPGDILWC